MEFSSSSSDEDGDDDEVFGESLNYGKRALENFIYSGGNLIDFSSTSSDEDGDDDEHKRKSVVGESSNYGKSVLENYIYSGANLIDFSSSSSDEDGDDDEHKRKSMVDESSNSGKSVLENYIYSGGNLIDFSSTSSDEDGDDDEHKRKSMVDESSNSGKSVHENNIYSGGHLIEFSSSSSDEGDDDDEHKGKSVVGESLNSGNNNGKNNKNLASGSRIVRGISSPSSGKDGKKNTGFLKAIKEKERVEDEECVILDYDPLQPPTTDFEDKLFISNHHPFGFEDGELIIISERGKVACRDYPHSRHHCANYPFNKTCHERCCPQCYCYVCDVVAPCKYWKGHDGHCHASDHDEIWKVRREIHMQMPLST